MMRETQSLVLGCRMESRASPRGVGFVQRRASYIEEGGMLPSLHVHQLSPQLLVWLPSTLYPSEKQYPAQSLGLGEADPTLEVGPCGSRLAIFNLFHCMAHIN